jgi:hypothetical protein
MGVTCAIIKLKIHCALLVTAVAFPRWRLPNISTGTAHASGPTASENTKLYSHVTATNARLAAAFVVPYAPASAAITTKHAPDAANDQISGCRRPSRSTYAMHSTSATSARTELPAWSASVVDVPKPILRVRQRLVQGCMRGALTQRRRPGCSTRSRRCP